MKASHCTVQVCNWTLFDLIQIMNVLGGIPASAASVRRRNLDVRVGYA